MLPLMIGVLEAEIVLKSTNWFSLPSSAWRFWMTGIFTMVPGGGFGGTATQSGTPRSLTRIFRGLGRSFRMAASGIASSKNAVDATR